VLFVLFFLSRKKRKGFIWAKRLNFWFFYVVVGLNLAFAARKKQLQFTWLLTNGHVKDLYSQY
jgi:hypothetical protein